MCILFYRRLPTCYEPKIIACLFKVYLSDPSYRILKIGSINSCKYSVSTYLFLNLKYISSVCLLRTETVVFV